MKNLIRNLHRLAAFAAPAVDAALSSLRETVRAGLMFGADQLVDQLAVQE
jgi:hypothetical protein